MIYIPFIHKISKKRKEKFEQIPLYIEKSNLPPMPEKPKEQEEKKDIIIIQL